MRGEMSWTYDKVVELAKRMEARLDKGFRVSAGTAPLVVEALKHYARERFGEQPRGYTVDIWTADDSRLELHYAQISDLFAAREAFTLAVKQYPHLPVTLRQACRIVERYKPTPPVPIRPANAP